jgi:hypothetical protein
MANPIKKRNREELETEPDAWDRFTKAVKKMKRPATKKSAPKKRKDA